MFSVALHGIAWADGSRLGEVVGMSGTDTIYGLSSGSGVGGVAVVRISGPAAKETLARLTGRAVGAPRQLVVRVLKGGEGEILDTGLVVWFPCPNSFTGEDTVELHVHGGRAVVTDILAAAGTAEGLRPADRGEFTRRAFENGRLDLTAAEAVADLVAADTSAQRQQALRQMRGELATVYGSWRERLAAGLAYLEAAIDFSDEELPENLETRVFADVQLLYREMGEHLDKGRQGERLRSGMVVAIIGLPNVGKSSLLNAIAARDVAIVAERAGTTRDVIEVQLDLGGYPVTLADSAGIRESMDTIELEGISRARQLAVDADLRLIVGVADDPVSFDGMAGMSGKQDIWVLNKADLLEEGSPVGAGGTGHQGAALAISAATGEGMDKMIQCLCERVEEMAGISESAVLTRERHRHQVEEAREGLARFLDSVGKSTDMRAEDLRLAWRSLGRITGEVDVDDLLDVIFSDFCIGK